MVRRLTMTVLATVMVMLGGLLTSSPAQAGTSAQQKIVTVSRPYTANWVFRSTAIRACIYVQISGTVRGTHRYAYHASGGTAWSTDYYLWYNTKLLNPRITATGWPISGSGCDSTKRVSFKKLSLSQSWYEGRCKLSAQVSAGYPWGISASPTFSCGDHRVARRSTSVDAPGSFARQVNSGAPVYFKGSYIARAGERNAFRANLRVTGYRKVGTGTVSDTFATRRAVAFL